MNQLDFAALWASHNANRANKQAGCPKLCLWWPTWTRSHLSTSFCFTLSYCFLILSPLICYYLFNCLVLAPSRLGSLFILQMVSLSFSSVVSVVAWWLTCDLEAALLCFLSDYRVDRDVWFAFHRCTLFKAWFVICGSLYNTKFDYESVFYPECKLKCCFNSSSSVRGGCVELPCTSDGNNGAQQWWIKLF